MENTILEKLKKLGIKENLHRFTEVEKKSIILKIRVIQ
jgi:hypothetical protein